MIVLYVLSDFTDLFQRPSGMLADEWRAILQGSFQGRNTRLASAISQCYGCVAKVTSPPGTLDRVIFELLVESMRRKPQVGNQIRGWQVRVC
jgi:hypothetical protein